MRLLFVIPEYLPQEGGGIITFYRHLLPELARQGHHVRVLVGSGVSLGTQRFEERGVPVEYLTEEEFRASLTRFRAFDAVPFVQKGLAAAWALWEKARGGEGFDLVETSDWGLHFVPWVLEEGPPVVVQLHGSMGQIAEREPEDGAEIAAVILRFVESIGLARATELQAYSRSNAAFWESVTGRSVTVIPPAWPVPAEPRREEGVAPGSAVVVARVQSWKGPDELCLAQRRLADRAPKVTWIGRETRDGRTGESYGSVLARTYGDVWGSRIVPIGPKSRRETDALRDRASFAIVPSRWDTFNFTCVEAMGSGIPVVCSTGAGAAEHVEDGVSGFVVPPEDADSLAVAIEKAMSLTESARRAMGSAGRERVRAALGVENVASRRGDRYREMTAVAASRGQTRSAWPLQTLRPGSDASPYAFLSQVPARELLRHGAFRVARKAVGRVTT